MINGKSELCEENTYSPPHHLLPTTLPTCPPQAKRAHRFAHLLSLLTGKETAVSITRLWGRGKKRYSYNVLVDVTDCSGYIHKDAVKRFEFKVLKKGIKVI